MTPNGPGSSGWSPRLHPALRPRTPGDRHGPAACARLAPAAGAGAVLVPGTVSTPGGRGGGVRPRCMEPHPRGPPRTVRDRGQEHLLRGDRPGAGRREKEPGLTWLNEVSPVPLLPCSRRCATSIRRSRRSSGRCRPLPPVQVPQRPPAGALHPAGVQHAQRGAAVRQDGGAAPLRAVVARRGRGRPGPSDGDRGPRAGQPLVHHSLSTPTTWERRRRQAGRPGRTWG